MAGCPANQTTNVALNGEAALMGGCLHEHEGQHEDSRAVYVFELGLLDLCDMNCDGCVDALDIEPFLNCLFP